jgi:hypothetical protein
VRQGIRSPTGWSVQRFCCKSKNHLGREYVAAIAVHEKNESLSSLRQFSQPILDCSQGDKPCVVRPAIFEYQSQVRTDPLSLGLEKPSGGTSAASAHLVPPFRP